MTEPVLQVVPRNGRVRVEIGGYLLADSSAVVEVREQGHDPVLYFPPQSVRMARLKESATTTHCPRKGDASYYSIAVGSCFEEDGVWYYPNPLDAAAELAGYMAFRGDAVDAFTDSGARVIGPARCNACEPKEQ